MFDRVLSMRSVLQNFNNVFPILLLLQDSKLEHIRFTLNLFEFLEYVNTKGRKEGVQAKHERWHIKQLNYFISLHKYFVT